MKTAILPPPTYLELQILRICRHCSRWFALRRVDSVVDAKGEQPIVYQCRHCGKETVDPGKSRYRNL